MAIVSAANSLTHKQRTTIPYMHDDTQSQHTNKNSPAYAPREVLGKYEDEENPKAKRVVHARCALQSRQRDGDRLYSDPQSERRHSSARGTPKGTSIHAVTTAPCAFSSLRNCNLRSAQMRSTPAVPTRSWREELNPTKKQQPHDSIQRREGGPLSLTKSCTAVESIPDKEWWHADAVSKLR